MVAKETTKTYTREELKKAKKAQKEQAGTEEKESAPKIRVRLLPIWLRVILVVVLMGISVIAGLVVGYGVIGNGNPEDALDKSTWQHIIDLVEKK